MLEGSWHLTYFARGWERETGHFQLEFVHGGWWWMERNSHVPKNQQKYADVGVGISLCFRWILFAWKQGNWSVGFLLWFATYHFLCCLWYFWYCLWCLEKWCCTEIFQKQFEGPLTVSGFMIEARVKSRFPRQIGKTSLTGLRTQAVKTLSVSCEDIWPGLRPHSAYTCVRYQEKMLALKTKLSGWTSNKWVWWCLSAEILDLGLFLKSEHKLSCCMMLRCGLMMCQLDWGSWLGSALFCLIDAGSFCVSNGWVEDMGAGIMLLWELFSECVINLESHLICRYREDCKYIPEVVHWEMCCRFLSLN